jgi:mono/diheme cytochrome c family protein
MRETRCSVLVAVVLSLVLLAGFTCTNDGDISPDAANRGTATDARYLHDATLIEAPLDRDLFPGMNGPGLQLTPTDRKGQIVWNLWTGDSYRMWDYLARHAFGTADLLKTIDSRGRSTRFQRIGIINQPGYRSAGGPDANGLFLDLPRPGDSEGEIDRHLDPHTYGRSSGVIGLRVFDNPEFMSSPNARQEWKSHIAADGVNHDFYEKPEYFNNPRLVRPYAVGMACSFCHVSFDPLRPPANVEEPRYAELNDYVGSQYLKVWEVFMPHPLGAAEDHYADSFVWQILHSSPQGSLDTSFVVTDYLNNPGTMNGLYHLPQRLSRAETEHLAGGALALRSVTADMNVPRVLKQGDDSVGFEGALSRVYVNIGEAWPEWRKHFRPLVGGPLGIGKPGQTALDVATLQRTSPSWNWSEERAPALAGYLVKVAKPLLLKHAPGGAKHLTASPATLDRGKIVFAENCAGCHSSKQPPAGTEAKTWFRQQVVSDPAFFTDNFLADERRHPVTDIGTNSTRAAATNAMEGHIWDNFSSWTYKTLPQVPAFTVDNPYAEGGKSQVTITKGGPGYYRPPSLISLWTSAPYLHNNTVGDDFGDPSVDGRMRAFQEGIERMLLIQPRHGKIWKTSRASYLTIPAEYLPPLTRKIMRDRGVIARDTDDLRIGPIPAGTPINLLSNTNLEGNNLALLKLFNGVAHALLDIKAKKMNETDATERMRQVIPLFLAVNKCPDFIEDKGHMFGTQLPMEDKRALIELLKTF